MQTKRGSKKEYLLSVEQMKGMTEQDVIDYHEQHKIGKDIETLTLFWGNFRESRGEKREPSGTIVYDEDSNHIFIEA